MAVLSCPLWTRPNSDKVQNTELLSWVRLLEFDDCAFVPSWTTWRPELHMLLPWLHHSRPFKWERFAFVFSLAPLWYAKPCSPSNWMGCPPIAWQKMHRAAYISFNFSAYFQYLRHKERYSVHQDPWCNCSMIVLKALGQQKLEMAPANRSGRL